MRRASPLARRAIPNCQTDGSLPGAEPVLLPSTPAPPPSPSAPAPSPPLYGEPPAPRADRPRKSRLYWKTGPKSQIIHSVLYPFPLLPSFFSFHHHSSSSHLGRIPTAQNSDSFRRVSIDTSDQKYFFLFLCSWNPSLSCLSSGNIFQSGVKLPMYRKEKFVRGYRDVFRHLKVFKVQINFSASFFVFVYLSFVKSKV